MNKQPSLQEELCINKLVSHYLVPCLCIQLPFCIITMLFQLLAKQEVTASASVSILLNYCHVFGV
jgi:hypothetical protein